MFPVALGRLVQVDEVNGSNDILIDSTEMAEK